MLNTRYVKKTAAVATMGMVSMLYFIQPQSTDRMVNNIDTKITKHVNDVIQKYASGLFRNATLEFYGIKTAPIKELINPELPKVEVSGGAADMVFLLVDDNYLHFAFETGQSGDKAVARCASYDLRLYERDGRMIHTVIIYTSDVKNSPGRLCTGSLVYNPDVILMGDYDGNAVFAELETKIKTGQDFTDLDMLNLVLLPLMRHTIPRKELAVKSIELAQAIPDITKRNACIAAAFAFANKYLDVSETNKLLEVLRMTDLGTMLVMDAVKDAVKDAVEERNIKVATAMLKDGMGISTVSRYTGLDEPTVRQLHAELDVA